MADVTVVIPAFQASATIERAVRSVIGQPNVACRTVVVIDGPCRATSAIVASLGGHDVRAIENGVNRGAPVSRNAGLAAVTTPYVLFLDADDLVTGDLMRGLFDAMRAGDADLGLGPWIWLNEETGACVRKEPAYRSPADLFAGWLLERRWTPPCAVLWRTAFVRSIGGWDETVRRNQDGELVLRGILAGATMAQSRRGAGIYVQHCSDHRITRSAHNYASLLEVAETLLATSSRVVAEPDRRAIVARYLYTLAVNAFARNDGGLGRAAMRRSRDLGFAGHRGSRRFRLLNAMVGVERYQDLRRTMAWLPAY